MRALPIVVCRLTLFAFLFLHGSHALAGLPPSVSGELCAWHRVTLTFDGPETNETAEPNPFLDYRLTVTFSKDGREYIVPGFYAADGNAADTGASSGSKWRVHFAPDSAGTWQYEVSFRTGPNVAVNDEPRAGTPVAPIDGCSGELMVLPTDEAGRDHRSKGRLQYVGERYLRFAETGEYFLKQGADAPENFLAYADFDGPFAADGHKDDLVKDWAPHVRDWRPGDPTWGDGRGKGIIGAVNYLASEGMNAISFLTLNIGGDDCNVFPYLDYDERTRMDVSRLDQWEIVFAHMDRRGIFLHFKTQETENEMLLDDGDLGVQRRLYYRELIARFGHHLALNWNLGEENGALGRTNQSTAQRHAMANYFRDHDPYGHPIVVHNGRMPDDLLGEGSSLTGFSLQTHRSDFGAVHDEVQRWVARSAEAGRPWVVACDEPGDAGHALLPDAEDPTHDDARRNALWGTLMAGGAGNEWYFGYRHSHSDLTCDDWRSRDLWWDQCRIALLFFQAYDIPLPRMKPRSDLAATGDWVLAGARESGSRCIVAYLRDGGTTTLRLPTGDYAFGWLNPRTGDGLQSLLNPGRMPGGGSHQVAAPGDGDWVLLIEETDGTPLSVLAQPGTVFAWQPRYRAPVAAAAPRAQPQAFQFDPAGAEVVFEEVDGLIAAEAEHFALQTHDDVRRWYLVTKDNTPDVEPDGDPNHAEGASGGAYLEILPDTRRTHGDPLIGGQNFSNEPGRLGVLYYPVYIDTPGRYYVWGRINCTGSEDNGLHVGIDGTWPPSGRRMQWVGSHGQWQWDSKQRTAQVHTGEKYKLYLDIEEPGLHTIMFSMREDGAEFDKWLMALEREFARPSDAGPPERRRESTR